MYEVESLILFKKYKKRTASNIASFIHYLREKNIYILKILRENTKFEVLISKALILELHFNFVIDRILIKISHKL